MARIVLAAIIMNTQALMFAGAMGIGIMIGGHMASHIFFGLILLGGLIALVENIPAVKWMVYKGNNFLDIAIWGISAAAIVLVGVTLAAALAVASLGYTMVYAPYVRRKMAERQSKKRNKVQY